MSKDAEYLLGSEAADAGLVFVSKLDESSKEQSDTILPAYKSRNGIYFLYKKIVRRRCYEKEMG